MMAIVNSTKYTSKFSNAYQSVHHGILPCRLSFSTSEQSARQSELHRPAVKHAGTNSENALSCTTSIHHSLLAWKLRTKVAELMIIPLKYSLSIHSTDLFLSLLRYHPSVTRVTFHHWKRNQTIYFLSLKSPRSVDQP